MQDLANNFNSAMSLGGASAATNYNNKENYAMLAGGMNQQMPPQQ